MGSYFKFDNCACPASLWRALIMHMTKVSDSGKAERVAASAAAGAPEVEVTDEMVAAGAGALRASDRDYDSEEIVALRVFEAMSEAARPPICVAGESQRSKLQSLCWWP